MLLPVDPNGVRVQAPLFHEDGIQLLTADATVRQLAIPPGWGGFYARARGAEILLKLGDSSVTVSDTTGGAHARLLDGEVRLIVRPKARAASGWTHLAYVAASGSGTLELEPVEG